MIRQTYVQVDLGAIVHNMRELKKLNDGAGVLAVVKADAYGHGMRAVSQALLDAGASILGVATVDEGIALRKSGILSPILVLGYAPPEAAEAIIHYDLIQTVFSEDVIRALDAEARKRNKMARVHIKLDTGMNRIGICDTAVLYAVLHTLKQCTHTELNGAFTHFYASDAADDSSARIQQGRFEQMVKWIRGAGFRPRLHISNSAAALNFPEWHYDFIRPGIALYGYYPSENVRRDIVLKPAMSWMTTVSQVKEIGPGDAVSYGATFVAQRSMRVATLMAGYGDGYKRCLSNVGQVLIHGQRASVVGRVCMDQFVVDVSHIPNVRAQDEVVLIGSQSGAHIGADEIARWADTISYEILLSVSSRVPRVYV